jgi:pimeloyl-ACP methyl ester carboxylesterase
VHGSVVGEPTWRFSAVPGYDWAGEEAKLGHASVTIDRLGFGASGLPDGNETCIGSDADVAHQIVSALRDGRYNVHGRAAPRFRRVAVAGLSAGGIIGGVEAYSFADVDALVSLSSAFDQGFSPATTADLLTNANGPVLVCARGGEAKYPGGPGGYDYTFKGTEATELFYDTAPAVIDAVIAAHEREPCGFGTSFAQTLLADALHLGDIQVPVLLVFGDHDVLFPPPDGQRQRDRFSGSRDVTLVQMADTGHALNVGRTAPAARAVVSRWLHARGF